MAKLEELPGSTACFQLLAQLHPAFPHGAAWACQQHFLPSCKRTPCPTKHGQEQWKTNETTQEVNIWGSWGRECPGQGDNQIFPLLCHGQPLRLAQEAWVFQEAVEEWDHHTRYQSASCPQCFFCFIQREECAAQVWTDRTELEAVGQCPGHWTAAPELIL